MTRIRLRGVVLHLVLWLAVVASVLPFVWTLVMATNSTSDIYRYPPKFSFGSQFDDNVRHVLANVAFFDSMLNTLVVAVSTTAPSAVISYRVPTFSGRRNLIS